MKKISMLFVLAGLMGMVPGGCAMAALNLEGQSGVFLNTLAYPTGASKLEVSAHTVDLDDLGSVSTYNVAAGLEGKFEVGYTSVTSSVDGVKNQNLFLGTWQFVKESADVPAVALWAIYRDQTDGPSSTDYGVSATKVVKVGALPLVLDLGARSTRAIGLGLFGFQSSREVKFEGSTALFVTPKFAVGTEFKQQIGGQAWHDIAFRWVPSSNLNIDFGIANLSPTLDSQIALAATWTR